MQNQLKFQMALNSKKAKPNIHKAYFYHFLFRFNTASSVIVPFFIIWGRISYFQVMILQSYFTFIIFVLEIPSGALADFFGKKRALALSALVLGSAALCYTIIPNFFLFFIAETLWAFGIALLSGTDEAFIYNTLRLLGKEKELSKYMARINTIGLISMMLAAPIGSIFAQFISYQFAMFFLMFTYFGAFLIALTYKEPYYLNNQNNHQKKERYFFIIKEGFRRLRESKTLRILCFQRVIIEVLIFSLMWIYQPYFLQLNVPIVVFGFISLMMSLTNIGFTNILPACSKKVKNKAKFLAILDLTSGIAFILIGFTSNFILGITFLLIIVAVGYPRYLLFVNGINRVVESENRATVLSTIHMFTSVLRTIFFIFIGYIVSWNIFAIFIIIGGLIIILTFFSKVKSEYL